jgi:hypothetical protein
LKLPTNARLNSFLYLGGASVSLAAVCALLYLAVRINGFWDFNVFYSSARSALQGLNFYATYGAERLPYWYFPWLAWFYIPFALLPYSIAKALYLICSLASAGIVIHVLGRFFHPRLTLALQLFITAMSLLMSMLLFIAGQMDFILLAVVTAVILLLDRGKPWLSGAFFPVLLFKPHLVTVFLVFALWRGGRAFRLAALLSTAILAAVAFILLPNWPAEMARMLSQYGGRSDNYWNFITLPQLLGSQENWSGTANLPVTLGLFALGLLVCWRFRRLPIVPFLAMTLSASMLCAPRAYTYNLPLLIPPMLWISVNRRLWGPLLWLIGGVVAMASNWSTGAYLIVVLVFALAALEARRMDAAPAGSGLPAT